MSGVETWSVWVCVCVYMCGRVRVRACVHVRVCACVRVEERGGGRECGSGWAREH